MTATGGSNGSSAWSSTGLAPGWTRNSSASTRTWLKNHTRIRHVFIPVGACWLNLREPVAFDVGAVLVVLSAAALVDAGGRHGDGCFLRCSRRYPNSPMQPLDDPARKG
ncbi:predicted protein [Streptomyces lividans TK24]|nr:predicted protein [Streptomyces lividans TK24]